MSRLVALVIVVLISLSLIAAQCAVAATAPPAESQAAGDAEGVAAPAGPVIKVMEPFARASMPNGAVYMRLTNEGDAGDRLISAATDVAETVELHETKMDENDVMKMSPIDAVELPAGGSATLEPGGMHVMLLGLKKELATGDTFELTLNFEQSGPQTIEVEVTEGMAMSHGQMAPEQAEGEMAEMDHSQEAETAMAHGQMESEQADGEMEAMDHSQEAETDMAHADEAGATAEHSHGADDHAASLAAALQPQVFEVVVATYLLDTAGFHTMDDRLNEAGQIDPGDAGVVNRVNRLLAVTDWPDELKAQVEELQTILVAYAEALSNDEVEAAKPLATQAHEAQHDLSHAIEHWLADQPMSGEHQMAAGEADQRFQVTIAAYLMDTAGFHAMDDRLNEAGQIDPGDAGVVNRVNRLLAVVDWPDELKAQVEELQTILVAYAEALSNDEVEAAKPLATQAHEVQHDLSHTIGSWLSGDHGPGEEHQPDETESHEDDAEHGD